MKSYKLLKDLPDAKAGDIYQQRELVPTECDNISRNADCIKLPMIQDHPDWFQEITQNPL